MSTAVEKEEQIDITKSYDALIAEIDFQCSFCDAVHAEIGVLNDKIKKAYEFTAKSSKGDTISHSLKSKWASMFILAREIHEAACMKKNMHQICGTDLSQIERYYSASKERFEYLSGVEFQACTN